MEVNSPTQVIQNICSTFKMYGYRPPTKIIVTRDFFYDLLTHSTDLCRFEDSQSKTGYKMYGIVIEQQKCICGAYSND